MAWTYNQASGVLAHNGQQAGVGYSGHGDGVNATLLESVPNVGPIPRGQWAIGDAIDHPALGPVAMPLTPSLDTATYGRGGFFIHGDEIATAGQELASHGCIILPRAVRMMLSLSLDRDLEVV